ncbi:iron ABC transporter permease [Niallia circulans]|uniref:FecCD family ABC transporter permease n=1 Tax=Niallia circulans TaxID=1397 RepID=UPI002041E3CF|nr:iron ABC transporter permease [Niallia circulans]MCM2982355.1 iron ABC transporter permease [Niallia circulans]
MLLLNNRRRIIGLIIGLLLLCTIFIFSIVLGYADTSFKTAIQAFQQFNGSNEHIIIKEVRLPRALIGTIVGSSLAITGALLQALTKNPMASPDILGINSGASFFVIIGLFFFSINSLQAFAWLAFLGAAAAGLIVYFLGSLGNEGLTPIKLTLAGAAMAAMFSSFAHGFLVMNESALEEVLFWMAGSVQGRSLEILFSVLPYMIIGTLLAFLISNKMNVYSMGEDVARGLGQRTGTVKLLIGISVILLSGSAVAVAGPIGFIGIVVPHIVKWLVGNDYRWILPFCSITGGILLLLADIGARLILMPQEVPVGIMTAIIGTPFFIYIARNGGKSS